MGEDLEFGMRDREGMCNEDWIFLPPARSSYRGRRHTGLQRGRRERALHALAGGDREIRNRRRIETERKLLLHLGGEGGHSFSTLARCSIGVLAPPSSCSIQSVCRHLKKVILPPPSFSFSLAAASPDSPPPPFFFPSSPRPSARRRRR